MSAIMYKSFTDGEIYDALLPQIKSIVDSTEPLITALSNISAVLYDAFDKISWIGFYLRKDNKLFLGPFQGKAACTQLNAGSGVCWASVVSGKSIIVEDVEKFPGHIACDAASRSEIVIPITVSGKVAAVLDADSYEYSSFSDIDKVNLEKVAAVLSENFDYKRFSLIL